MLELRDADILRDVLESLRTGLALVDRDRRILLWNSGAERLTGFLRQEVIGRYRCEIAPNSDGGTHLGVRGAIGPLNEALRDGKEVEAQVHLRHKCGHEVSLMVTAIPIRNREGAIVGAAESYDRPCAYTGLDRRQDRLAERGYLDAVTGLPSPGFTHSHLREQLAISEDYFVPLSILIIEIDHVEHLRATHGQQAVETILRVVAHALKNALRLNDMIGRSEGDQFLAVLAQCGSGAAITVAERLRNLVTHSGILWWGDQLSATVSIGGTTVRAGDSMHSVLERAERHLAESIGRGGNTVTVSEV